MTAQRTLVLLKPDAVQRGLRGEILRRIEAKGYDIIALAQRTATAEELAAHYAEHEGKPFYPGLVEYMQQDRWYVRFEEVDDRTGAASLRGIDLVLSLDAEQEAEEDPDAWYPAQLKGLSVRHVDGRELGTVAGVDHYPAQDLLVVRTPDRRRVQLPLVEELVPEVDLEQGVVIADPPGGLFDALPEDEQGPEPETSAPPRGTR